MKVQDFLSNDYFMSSGKMSGYVCIRPVGFITSKDYCFPFCLDGKEYPSGGSGEQAGQLEAGAATGRQRLPDDPEPGDYTGS